VHRLAAERVGHDRDGDRREEHQDQAAAPVGERDAEHHRDDVDEPDREGAGSESRAGTASTQLSSGPRLNMGSPTMSDDVVHWPSSGEWLLSTS
jgi:hypothetical protein